MLQCEIIAALCCLFTVWTVQAAFISNEILLEPDFTTWPRGSYGFLMHENGCPPEVFEEGMKTFDTEDNKTFNLWPLDGGVRGQFSQDGMTFHFCTKEIPDGAYSWPSGTYCMHRVGGRCPKGFRNGSILFDEEDSKTLTVLEGILPDGVYGNDTTMYFCCRNDRSPDHQIQIPKSFPFYLYPHHGQSCQQVLGMTSKIQRFLLDTEDSRPNDRVEGSYPEAVLNKVGVLLYVCQYTPIEDEHGDEDDKESTTPGSEEEKEEETVIIIVRKDWPSGSFGLPMAGDSCPDYNDFTKGYLYQDTEDLNNQNSWPSDVSMKGPLKSEGYRMHYCSKFSMEGTYEWPAGDYCIHRVGGECPAGFTEGSVRFDDEDSQNANDRRGELPDGVFDSDTLLFFCCREDAAASKPISLPNNKPFYLYRYAGPCQEVANMTSRIQVIQWDDENVNNTDRRTGATPMGDVDDVGIRLYFCLYEPTDSQIPRNDLTSSNSWPRGRFSLWMTEDESCPNFFDFKKGTFYHMAPKDGAATTVYGHDNLRHGKSETGRFDGGFCSKDSPSGGYDWPVGRYCINRFGGVCPDGFQDGSVYFDNYGTLNKYHGVLPDGNFERGTKFEFCCRNDGDYNVPIKLPTSHPFILWLPHTAGTMHDYNCQKVEGMKTEPTILQIAIKVRGESSVSGLSPGNLSNVAIYMVYCMYVPEGY